MTAPVILLIAVAASPNGVAMTQKAASACIESLRLGAKSMVRVVPTVPNDLDLAADASIEGANALVVLTWHDEDVLTTAVRVSVSPPGVKPHDWVARTVVFSPRDLEAERGRTLGLVIASMLREAWGTEILSDREVEAAASPIPVQDRAVALQATPAMRLVAVAALPDLPSGWAIEANITTILEGTAGLDFDALGGTFALRRGASHRLAWRAGLGYRVTTVDGTDATTRTASAAFGVAWASRSLGQSHQIGFGARSDLMVLHEEVSRDSQISSPPSDQGYWSLGGDLLGQVGYGLSRATTLLLGGGVEETLTAADLVVAGRPVATIPHARSVFEVGILSRL
jgi:hypothetical protein